MEGEIRFVAYIQYKIPHEFYALKKTVTIPDSIVPVESKTSSSNLVKFYLNNASTQFRSALSDVSAVRVRY